MIMSNEEKDKFIRDTLSKDKYVFSGNDSYKELVSSEIETSNVKPSMLNHNQKIAIIVIVVALIAIFSIGKLLPNSKNNIKNDLLSNQNMSTSVEKQPNNKRDDTIIQKTNIEKNENTVNSINVEAVETSDNDKYIKDKELQGFLKTINEEKLKEELKMYALGIGRFDKVLNSREENTILLLLAMDFFSELNKYNNNGIDVSNKYTLIDIDANDFIKELTGIKNSKILDSYNNYIGYSEARKAYILGVDGNPFENEEYNVLSCNYSSYNDETFVVSGQIEKTIDRSSYIYQYEAHILRNSDNYKYFPYQIKEFSYKIEEGKDSVFRLIDETEEIENVSIKKN